MNLVPLGDLTQRAQTATPRKQEKETFVYVDLTAVDNRLKMIVSPRSVEASAAPSRARQVIHTGDVLVSTVRPNLNAVAFVPNALNESIASTGFTVLRPIESLLDNRYLYHWVRTPQFIAEMTRKSTGASYPAVSDRIVKESRIPLPSIDEQRQIAAILDAADALQRKRRQALELLSPLADRIFDREISSEERTATLSDAVESLVGGKNLVGNESSTNPYRVLKISAVTSGRYLEHESKSLPEGYKPPTDHVVRAGDVLISRANTAELVGACALVPATGGRAVLPDKVWRAVPRPGVNPRFLVATLQSRTIRAEIGARATGTGGSMKNIAKPKLLSIPIHMPPCHVQNRIAEQLMAMDRLRDQYAHQLERIEVLFASLQQRAFMGQL